MFDDCDDSLCATACDLAGVLLVLCGKPVCAALLSVVLYMNSKIQYSTVHTYERKGHHSVQIGRTPNICTS